MGSLYDEKREIEKALAEGRVEILGEPGRVVASRAFVESLGALPPSARRVVIARACALPWLATHHDVPDGYKQALAFATQEGIAEYGSMDALEERLVNVVVDSFPIDESVLRQILPKSPAERYSTILFLFASLWVDEYESPEMIPRWLDRDLNHASWLHCTNATGITPEDDE